MGEGVVDRRCDLRRQGQGARGAASRPVERDERAGDVRRDRGRAGHREITVGARGSAVRGRARAVRVACEPFATDRPYFVARLVLRTALGIGLDANASEAGGLLMDWLQEHAPDWAPFAPLLAASIDADVPTTDAVDGSRLRLSGRFVLRDAASAVLKSAFAEPLVLVVEDAMWMDEASAQLLARRS